MFPSILGCIFKGVWVIEKDKGFEGSVGSIGGPHQADSIWRINPENYFSSHDNIGFRGTPDDLNAIKGVDSDGQPIYEHSYPNEFIWNCLFRTYKILIPVRMEFQILPPFISVFI